MLYKCHRTAALNPASKCTLEANKGKIWTKNGQEYQFSLFET